MSFYTKLSSRANRRVKYLLKLKIKRVKTAYWSGTVIFKMFGLGALVGMTVEAVEALFKCRLDLVLARMSIFSGGVLLQQLGVEGADAKLKQARFIHHAPTTSSQTTHCSTGFDNANVSPVHKSLTHGNTASQKTFLYFTTQCNVLNVVIHSFVDHMASIGARCADVGYCYRCFAGEPC